MGVSNLYGTQKECAFFQLEYFLERSNHITSILICQRFIYKMRTPFKLLTIPCFCDWFEESNNYSLQNKSEVICLFLQSKNMEQYPQPILKTTILITTIHEYINSIKLCSKNLLIYKRAFFKTTKPNVKKIINKLYVQ